MKIIIIGAVAGGTSAAAKARRNDEDATITIYEKDKYISYSGCGMPYFLGQEFDDPNLLVPRDSSYFKKELNVDIKISHEVLKINPNNKTVEVKNLSTDEVFTDNYDKLVIATGAKPIIPNIIGVDNPYVFTLRNINNMFSINDYITKNNPKSVVIVGTGFIGLELCEGFKNIGLDVTLVERKSYVSGSLDEDMAGYVKEYLLSKNIKIYNKANVVKIDNNEVFLEDNRSIKTDFVIISTGVNPETTLAKEAGIKLGIKGTIAVDNRLETSVKDIYACGDCIEHLNSITNKPTYKPLGSTANKTGRIVGDVITGGSLVFKGIIGTGIYKIFDFTVAQTGLTEKEAIENGYNPLVIHNIKPNKPTYMGGKEMIIKAIACKDTGLLLGAQIVGYEGVDKRIDVFATAISFKAYAPDLADLDLAYSPPYSNAKDPVNYTGMIIDNALNKNKPTITPKDFDELVKKEKVQVIDTRENGNYEISHIDCAVKIEFRNDLNKKNNLDKNIITVVYCNKGLGAASAQNYYLNKGFKRVYNLSGGYLNYKAFKNK